MSDIHVDSARRRLIYAGRGIACLIGRSGPIAADLKREGDGATPLGRWPIRCLLLRPDRVSPGGNLHLPHRFIRPADGWSDDVADPAYNRPVVHPHPHSAEHLFRADSAYDVILTLAHNDAPPHPGHGSAIFLHVADPAAAFTEGCVAIPRDELLMLLPGLRPGDAVVIG